MHRATAAVLGTVGVFVGVGYLVSGTNSLAQAPVEQLPGKVRQDHFGDPLPQHALARFGSRRLWLGNDSGVMLLAFSGNGKRLASATSKGRVRVWDAATGQMLHLLREDVYHLASALAWSPDGKLLAVADGVSQPWIDLYAFPAGTKRRLSVDKPFSPHLLEFSPDGKTLAVVSQADHLPERLTLWDVSSGKWARTLAEDIAGVLALVFSEDGATLTTLSGDGQLRQWNPTTGKTTGLLPGVKGKVGVGHFLPEDSSWPTSPRRIIAVSIGKWPRARSGRFPIFGAITSL